MKFSSLKQTITSISLVLLISTGSAYAAPKQHIDQVTKAFKAIYPDMANALTQFNKELSELFQDIMNDKVVMPYGERLDSVEQKLKEFEMLFIIPLEQDPNVMCNPTKKKVLDAVKQLHQEFLTRVAIFNKGRLSMCHDSAAIAWTTASAIATALKTIGYQHLIPAEHAKRNHESGMITKLQKCLQVQR